MSIAKILVHSVAQSTRNSISLIYTGAVLFSFQQFEKIFLSANAPPPCANAAKGFLISIMLFNIHDSFTLRHAHDAITMVMSVFPAIFDA